MVNRGRFCAPISTFTNSLHFPALSDTVTIHNQAYLFITITLYLLWIFGDDQTRFSRWLTFFTFAAAVALAHRQKPTPGRCRQRAVVWLAKQISCGGK